MPWAARAIQCLIRIEGDDQTRWTISCKIGTKEEFQVSMFQKDMLKESL